MSIYYFFRILAYQNQTILAKIVFDTLSEKDIAYIKVVHSDTDLKWDQRMSMLVNKFGVGERQIRRWIAKLGFSSRRPEEGNEVKQGQSRNYNPDAKVYFFTWAQNATPVHKDFFENMEVYAKHRNAEIGVIMGRYQNPTSLWSESMENDEWWDDKVHPYMDAGRHEIHPYLDLLSDVKVRPTAVNPLNGFEGISGERSSIIGHPRVHFKSLPVLNGHPNKFLLTTGACTIRNYTDTKSGKKAEFHHTYGFVVVEIQDDYIFHVRQVTANQDGSFTDLDSRVREGEITKVKNCSAFVMGDIHAANLHEPTMRATMDLFAKISPKNIVLHDVFDGQSVNHHEAKDPIKAYERYKKGANVLSKEIENLKELINSYNLLRYNPIVVRSNHDMWLDRWISQMDWKKDIPNSETYMEYGLALLRGEAPKGLLPYILESEYGDKITCLGEDDSYKINGWELAQHGHLGAHGSKGNLEQYKKLNTKVIVGDYHQPGRKDGAVGVGTYSELRMGYNKGASAWMHAGALLHDDGKVQLILFQTDEDGTAKFTTFF